MYNRLPTATRAFIRMHAPCSERSSIRAVSACTVPDWSSHNASTKIITAVRGSSLGPLILPSIGNLNEQFNHHPARTPNSEHYFFLICHWVPRPKVFRLRVFLRLHQRAFHRLCSPARSGTDTNHQSGRGGGRILYPQVDLLSLGNHAKHLLQ